MNDGLHGHLLLKEEEKLNTLYKKENQFAKKTHKKNNIFDRRKVLVVIDIGSLFTPFHSIF